MTLRSSFRSSPRCSKRATLVFTCDLMLKGCVFVVIAACIILCRRLFAQQGIPAASQPAMSQRRSSAPTKYYWKLHSTNRFSEARVPFTYTCHNIRTSSEWMIIVKAILAGKKLQCLVDTGAIEVTWPQSLKLRGEHSIVGTAHGINNSRRQTEIVTLPNVSIGDYELSYFPTYMIKRGVEAQGIADTVPIIGSLAFRGVVITIDYQHRMLILRDPEYNVALQPRSKQDLLLDLERINDKPIARGTIEGYPAKFLVDTGCNGRITVAEHFANAHLRDRKLMQHTVTGAFGKMQQARLDNVRCSIGSLKVQAEQAGITKLPGDEDGLIGKQFLAFYDVTIDFSRHKLLLHRNTQRGNPGTGL